MAHLKLLRICLALIISTPAIFVLQTSPSFSQDTSGISLVVKKGETVGGDRSPLSNGISRGGLTFEAGITPDYPPFLYFYVRDASVDTPTEDVDVFRAYDCLPSGIRCHIPEIYVGLFSTGAGAAEICLAIDKLTGLDTFLVFGAGNGVSPFEGESDISADKFRGNLNENYEVHLSAVIPKTGATPTCDDYEKVTVIEELVANFDHAKDDAWFGPFELGDIPLAIAPNRVPASIRFDDEDPSPNNFAAGSAIVLPYDDPDFDVDAEQEFIFLFDEPLCITKSGEESCTSELFDQDGASNLNLTNAAGLRNVKLESDPAKPNELVLKFTPPALLISAENPRILIHLPSSGSTHITDLAGNYLDPITVDIQFDLLPQVSSITAHAGSIGSGERKFDDDHNKLFIDIEFNVEVFDDEDNLHGSGASLNDLDLAFFDSTGNPIELRGDGSPIFDSTPGVEKISGTQKGIRFQLDAAQEYHRLTQDSIGVRLINKSDPDSAPRLFNRFERQISTQTIVTDVFDIERDRFILQIKRQIFNEKFGSFEIYQDSNLIKTF